MTPAESFERLERNLRRLKRALAVFLVIYGAALIGLELWHRGQP